MNNNHNITCFSGSDISRLRCDIKKKKKKSRKCKKSHLHVSQIWKKEQKVNNRIVSLYYHLHHRSGSLTKSNCWQVFLNWLFIYLITLNKLSYSRSWPHVPWNRSRTLIISSPTWPLFLWPSLMEKSVFLKCNVVSLCYYQSNMAQLNQQECRIWSHVK